MRHAASAAALAVALGTLTPLPASAQIVEGPGLRVGVGTDISLGIAFGGELNYLKDAGGNMVELGITVFRGNSEEESNNGFNDYFEETTLVVGAATVNYLFLDPDELSEPYLLAGVGFGAVSVEWEERSPTDTSLGTPLPGGGSSQAEDGVVGGTILNLGLGKRFSENLDLRIQAPTFFIFDAPGEAASVVPTLTVTAGFRF